jgi:uncharacterized membrane protein YiaA
MILQLLIICIIVGAVVYIVGLLPIDATLKTIIKVIAIVVLAIYAIKLLLPLAGI